MRPLLHQTLSRQDAAVVLPTSSEQLGEIDGGDSGDLDNVFIELLVLIRFVWSLWEQKMNTFLVGGIPTPLKNMRVSWEYDSQYMEK